MDELSRINSIRRSEEQSHVQMYSEHRLFEQGSWLSSPVKSVLSLLTHFQHCQSLHVLDLGCGVGRNSIPIAKSFSAIPCIVDCVDILPLAIEKLRENSALHQCSHSINGIVSSIETYPITQNTYDFIFAVSALEHICSYEAFLQKLHEIKNGLKRSGLFCLIISTDISETDLSSGEMLVPQFELNLTSQVLKNALMQVFEKDTLVTETCSVQQYTIPRDERQVQLSANVYTYVFKKEH